MLELAAKAAQNEAALKLVGIGIAVMGGVITWVCATRPVKNRGMRIFAGAGITLIGVLIVIFG